MDTQKTKPVAKVIFRKFKNKDITELIALFPKESYKANYFTSSYMHIGQHSDVDYHTVISMTTLATPEEYADLKTELESIGYVLDVKKKATITYR
jgi:hypothetical protein